MEELVKKNIEEKMSEVYSVCKEKDTQEIIQCYDELIQEFDEKKITDYDTICYFYRKLFESVTLFPELELVEKMSSKLLAKLNRNVSKNSDTHPYFNPVMDILVLSGLSYYRMYPLVAIQYFEKACLHGEKYLMDSKRDFHDSLCCAITWVGSLYYNLGEYEKSLVFFNKALELYESVKDLEGFYFKEYSPDTIRNYISSINNILSK